MATLVKNKRGEAGAGHRRVVGKAHCRYRRAPGEARHKARNGFAEEYEGVVGQDAGLEAFPSGRTRPRRYGRTKEVEEPNFFRKLRSKMEFTSHDFLPQQAAL